MPAMDRSIVVLPEPEGPNNTAIPCSTEKFTCSANVTHPLVLNCFLRSTRSMGSGALLRAGQDISQINGRDRGKREDQSEYLRLPVFSSDERFENG